MPIVKVQISSAPADGSALVYAEGGKWQEVRHPAKHVLAALNGDVVGHFEAMRGMAGWIIGNRVADQPW
jgi:hypothetical protein